MSGHSRCLPARLGVWAASSIAFQALAGCSLPGEVRWAGGGPLPGATENLGKPTGSIEVIPRSGQPDGQPSSKPRFAAAAIEGEVVVGFDSPDGLPLRLEDASTKRFATKEILRLDSGVALVQLPDGMAMDEATAILANQPGVRSVVRNYKLSPSELPVSDDPLITDQWAFGPEAADILGAWKAIEAGSASAIASKLRRSTCATLPGEAFGLTVTSAPTSRGRRDYDSVLPEVAWEHLSWGRASAAAGHFFRPGPLARPLLDRGS